MKAILAVLWPAVVERQEQFQVGSLTRSLLSTLSLRFNKRSYRHLEQSTEACPSAKCLVHRAPALTNLLHYNSIWRASIKYHQATSQHYRICSNKIKTNLSNSMMKNSDRPGEKWSPKLANSSQHPSTLLTRHQKPRERKAFSNLNRSLKLSRLRTFISISLTAQ